MLRALDLGLIRVWFFRFRGLVVDGGMGYKDCFKDCAGTDVGSHLIMPYYVST